MPITACFHSRLFRLGPSQGGPELESLLAVTEINNGACREADDIVILGKLLRYANETYWNNFTPPRVPSRLPVFLLHQSLKIINSLSTTNGRSL
jgi:hypothetical protein